MPFYHETPEARREREEREVEERAKHRDDNRTMTVNVHHRNEHEIPKWALDIIRKQEHIMATQAELTQTLQDVLAQLRKSAGEIATVQAESATLQQKVADLEAAVTAGGTVTPELEAAVAAVKAQAQVVDDAIPDAPVAPAP